ncbi:ATP-binding protein [Maridesulfovibrio sp.]|uniref:ATP-binding protein n=1 Tax=Maridesulfovibrio sp. TaxID=2795000 RepID=UPI002AA7881F|nr:ATP-binding protein [Maridesulfovibrio sp.]
MQFLKGPIRKKIIFIVILATLPVLAALLMHELRQREEDISVAKQKVRTFLHGFSEVQRTTTSSTRALLQTIAAMPEIKNKDPEKSTVILKTLLKANPIFTNVFLLNLDGTVVALGKGKDKGFNFSDRKQFKDALSSGEFAAGEFIIGRQTKITAFPFGVPVFNDDGKPTGVIIVGTNLNHYKELFNNSDLLPGAFFGLCDRQGTRLLRIPTSKKIPIGRPIKAEVFNAARNADGPGMLEALTSDRLIHIVAFEPVRMASNKAPYMYMFMGLHKDLVVADANAEMIKGGILGVLSLCIALTVTWFLGYSAIVSGIEKLTKATTLFGRGDDVISGVDYSDGEIGQLGQAFDNMAGLLHKREKEVRSLQSYLSNIVDSMPSNIIGVTPDGIVTQWNAKAEVDFGLSKKDVLGKKIEQVVPYLAGEMKKVRTAIDSRSVQAETKHVRRVNDKTVYEDITVYPLIADGVQGAVIRIDDITNRVNLEQALVQTEKMMSLGGLAAGMAHEINNPLAGILGSAYNVSKRLFSDMDSNRRTAQECGIELEQVHEYLEKRKIPKMIEIIKESGERAANIVSNMLSFSRKSGKRMEKVNIASLIDKTLELAANDYDLKKLYDFKQINVVREYEDNLPLVMCESNELQQVFLNLFRNGAEAMNEKSYTDGKPSFWCRILCQHGLVVIEIEDNGPGMEEHIQSRIFEPFFTTKEVGKGTGLGLSVSYFIITEQHNGKMFVESVAGVGTKFIIEMPVEGEA